jgi:tetratricopeptide (TPR) repeat protein
LAAKRPKPAPAFSAFISHAKADAKKAQAIAEGLEARGFKCWIAPRDVKAGRTYGDEIIRGIEGSRAFVLVLSKASNESAFVAREVERAVSKKKPVLALRIANVAPGSALELFVASTQWIDAFPGKLGSAVDQLAERLAEEEGIEPAEPKGTREPRRLPKWTLPLGAATSLLLIIGVGLTFLPDRRLPLIGPTADPAVLTEPAWQESLPQQALRNTEMDGNPPETNEQVAGVQTHEFNDETIEGALERPGSAELGLDRDFRACEKYSGADAIAACDRAIASGKFTSGKLSYLYNDRGFLLMQKGAIDAAIVDLNKAIEIDSTNFYAYWNRGAVYAARNDFDTARADFTTALALNPDQASKAKIEEALNAVVASAGASKSDAADPSVITDPSVFWRGREGVEGSAAATAPAYPAEAMPAYPAAEPPAMAIEPSR